MKRARNLGGLLATSQRRDGVAMFARELERRFGRIEDLFEESSVDIITRPYLAKSDLEKLFRHEACAVHVPGFYPKKAAANAACRLEGQSTQNWKVSSPRGLESSDVLSVGKPYNVAAQQGPEAVEGQLGRVNKILACSNCCLQCTSVGVHRQTAVLQIDFVDWPTRHSACRCEHAGMYLHSSSAVTIAYLFSISEGAIMILAPPSCETVFFSFFFTLRRMERQSTILIGDVATSDS